MWVVQKTHIVRTNKRRGSAGTKKNKHGGWGGPKIDNFGRMQKRLIV